jgi:hypothetical protein
MQKVIEWKLDVCGEEPEVFNGKEPVGAVPQEAGILTPGCLRWAYKKGERTRVQVLSSGKCQTYRFLDIRQGHEIEGISPDAFRFVD